MFKNFFKKFTPPLIEVVHYSAYFETIDGEKHQYTRYKYADPTQLVCSIPEYLMYDIKTDGYLEDDNGFMYPLQNVVRIEWKEDARKTVEQGDRWKIFY